MLAKAASGLTDSIAQLRTASSSFLAEWKYDGVRAQIHVLPPAADASGDVAVKVFSRNCEDRTGAFPDVVAQVLQAAKGGASSFILDAEIVAVERCGASGSEPSVRLRPFQELSARARGDVQLVSITVDVCVFVFDLLEFDGESLLQAPLRERRQRLLAALPGLQPGRVQLAEGHVADGADAGGDTFAEDGGASGPPAALVQRLGEWLLASVAVGAEGLMLKNLDAPYLPSRRSDQWWVLCTLLLRSCSKQTSSRLSCTQRSRFSTPCAQIHPLLFKPLTAWCCCTWVCLSKVTAL